MSSTDMMRQRPCSRFTRLRAVTALACTSLAVTLTLGAADAQASGVNGPIDRSEVLTRAQSWINERVPYSQDNAHPWVDANGSYRSDCSGYVSMAWHLGASLVTWNFNPVDNKGTFAGITYRIAASDLQPGDALVKDSGGVNHIALFVRWSDAAHTHPVMREEADYGEVAKEDTWGGVGSYIPIRYNRITGATPPPTPGKYWVDTSPAASGRSTPGGTVTGTLYAGTNYVFCKVWGPEVRVGASYNHYWLRTDLDVGPANQWVSAYYLSRWGNDEAKDNSGTVIPNCPAGLVDDADESDGPETESLLGTPAQQFDKGPVLGHPSMVYSVAGRILDHYRAVGARVGFPTMDAQAAAVSPQGTHGRYQYFEGGLFLWSQATDAHLIQGAILRQFEDSGREALLGYPTGDEETEGDGRRQTFQNATIHVNAARGTWVTH